MLAFILIFVPKRDLYSKKHFKVIDLANLITPKNRRSGQIRVLNCFMSIKVGISLALNVKEGKFALII
jgi:hypothetical protein